MKPMIRKLSSPALWVPGSVVGFSAVYLLGCQELTFGSLALPEEGFMPYIFGFLLLGTGSLLVLLTLRGEEVEEFFSLHSLRELSHLIKLMGTLIFYVALLPILGFTFCSFWATLAFSRIIGAALREALILAALMTGVTLFLFRICLKIPLPPPFFL